MKYFLAAVFFLFTAGGFAQNNMEDVMYLKNGNIYRGTIVEQMPGINYKIQITGGSIFTVTVPEVEKITKEPRHTSAIENTRNRSDNYRMEAECMRHQRDTSRIPSYLKKRKPFRELEFRPGINNVGLRIVHGYKFGRFGFLGIGFGADAVSFSNRMSTGKDIFDNSTPDNGLYLPLYIHYSGEILRKRITPYYYVEAGYAAHPNNPFVSNKGNKSWGGPTAAAGFGVKFYSKGRASLAINMNANWRTNRYRSTYSTTDVFGNAYTYTTRGTSSKVFGALGLCIGF